MQVLIKTGTGPKNLNADNTIVMGTVDGKIKLHLDPKIDFEVAMNMLAVVTEKFMNNYAGDDREKRENIYDYYNAIASSLLSRFIPDAELRPDLTETALLKLENEILESGLTAEEYIKKHNLDA